LFKLLLLTSCGIIYSETNERDLRLTLEVLSVLEHMDYHLLDGSVLLGLSNFSPWDLKLLLKLIGEHVLSFVGW
jgi:hypothetical protein